MSDTVSGVLLRTVNARSRIAAGALALSLLIAQVASTTAAVAQDAALPDEQSPRVSLSCINARATTDGHVHLVGGRGRAPRYLVLPALACDGTTQPSAETTTIWWLGSIWHVTITVESAGERIVCEEEGMQVPALVKCPIADGEAAVAIEPAAEAQTGPSPSDAATPVLFRP